MATAQDQSQKTPTKSADEAVRTPAPVMKDAQAPAPKSVFQDWAAI